MRREENIYENVEQISLADLSEELRGSMRLANKKEKAKVKKELKKKKKEKEKMRD